MTVLVDVCSCILCLHLIFSSLCLNMYMNYAWWMQQHETLSSIHITSFHSNLISNICIIYTYIYIYIYIYIYYILYNTYKLLILLMLIELLPVLFSNRSHLRSWPQVKMLALFCKFLIMFKNFDGKKQWHYRAVIEIWQLLEFS